MSPENINIHFYPVVGSPVNLTNIDTVHVELLGKQLPLSTETNFHVEKFS